jgi:hypothetical protein
VCMPSGGRVAGAGIAGCGSTHACAGILPHGLVGMHVCGMPGKVYADSAGSPRALAPLEPALEPTLQSASEQPVECARGSMEGEGSTERHGVARDCAARGMTRPGAACGVVGCASRQVYGSSVGSDVGSMLVPGSCLKSLPCPAPDGACCAPVDACCAPDGACSAPAEVHIALAQNGSTCGESNILVDSGAVARCTCGDVAPASRGATRNAWHRRAAHKARACCSRAARMLRGCFGC